LCFVERVELKLKMESKICMNVAGKAGVITFEFEIWKAWEQRMRKVRKTYRLEIQVSHN